MTISRHSHFLSAAGVELRPETMTLSLDEERVPFAQLTATCALGSGAETLDPTLNQRVSVRLRQDFGSSETIAAISADYVGMTIGDMAGEPENLLDNPDFEVDTSGWLPDVGATLTRDTAVFHDGVASGRIDDTDSTFGANQATPWPIPTGGGFIVRGWYRHQDSVNHTITPSLYWFDADGTQVGASGGQIAVSAVGGVWHRYEPWLIHPHPLHLTAGATQAIFRFAVTSSLATTKRAWMDTWFVSRAYGGIRGLSDRYGVPYNSTGLRESTVVRADLGLRLVNIDYAAGLVTIEASSDEALLQDYALVQGTVESPSGGTVRDCVNMVLSRVLGTAVATVGTGTQSVETDARPWEPGENGWSYVQSIVGMAGLRLWCDEKGLWNLEDPEQVLIPGQVVLKPETLGELAALSDRSGEWADSAVVTYRWTDSGGVSRVRHDPWNQAGTKAVQVEIERPFPGYGLARAVARRLRARRRVLEAAGVSDYSIRPYRPATVTLPDETTNAGVVSSVFWSQPDDRMEVGTRDIMSIGPNSWLYTPSGVSWDDVAVGTSWDEYAWGV